MCVLQIGSTPLHKAAANDVHCVKSLLEAGAKVNAKDDVS